MSTGAARSFLRATLAALPLLLLAGAADPAAALRDVPPQDATPADPDCGERASITVTVLDSSGLIPFPTATVVLGWGAAVERPIREPAGDEGRLLLCAPPAARQATLWAEFGDASSEEQILDLEARAAHEVELRLVFAEAPTGRLVGRVRDARSHRPVAAAAVSVTGRREEVQSDRRGQFVMSALPVGPYDVSIRNIGYAPLTHRVMITRGHTTEVDVRLSPDPVELEPLVATATRIRRLETQGFYERKYWGELTGGGRFFTVQDIERRNPLRITHMIADVPGVRVRCGGRGIRSCRVYSGRITTGFTGRGCEMTVYVDGTPVIQPGRRNPNTIDEFVLPIEIGGVEIYPGAGSLAAEFSGSDARCGAIVIWTK
ncbi:carboxypeptidase regulatory-like domain-containing protein [Candidatus Palauibacter sp.]|uniref:TonB-dependent receptor n=1 Tax=Candidatus Palauibacter sp. TaxID=3101350 RepID=UPI003B01228D